MSISKLSMTIIVLAFGLWLSISYALKSPKINWSRTGAFMLWRIATSLSLLGFSVSLVLASLNVDHAGKLIPICLVLAFILGNTEYFWMRKREKPKKNFDLQYERILISFGDNEWGFTDKQSIAIRGIISKIAPVHASTFHNRVIFWYWNTESHRQEAINLIEILETLCGSKEWERFRLGVILDQYDVNEYDLQADGLKIQKLIAAELNNSYSISLSELRSLKSSRETK